MTDDLTTDDTIADGNGTEDTLLQATAAPAPAPTWWEEGRHPVHVAHLVMGLVLAGLLVVWALLWSGAVAGADARWLLPLPWLLGGGIGLLAAGRSARRRSPARRAADPASAGDGG